MMRTASAEHPLTYSISGTNHPYFNYQVSPLAHPYIVIDGKGGSGMELVNGRLTYILWGQIQLAEPQITLHGWVTLDADDCDNHRPLEIDIHAITNIDVEELQSFQDIEVNTTQKISHLEAQFILDEDINYIE